MGLTVRTLGRAFYSSLNKTHLKSKGLNDLESLNTVMGSEKPNMSWTIAQNVLEN